MIRLVASLFRPPRPAQPRRRRPLTGVIESRNLLLETENYVLEAFVYDHDRLVVTFDNATSAAHKTDAFAPGWGVLRLRRDRQSNLTIKPKSPCWYQHPDLAEALRSLKQQGFFEEFRAISTYGGSMGGFGALVYADLIGAERVIALNPQSSLHPERVAWDTRFPAARTVSWDGPFADTSGKLRHPRHVTVVLDKTLRRDCLHARRLAKIRPVTLVNAPFCGHGVAGPLARYGALPLVLDHVRGGPLDLAAFNRALRNRRLDPAYPKRLKVERLTKGQAWRKAIIERFEAEQADTIRAMQVAS